MKVTLKLTSMMTLLALSSATACGGSSKSSGDGDGDGDGDQSGDGDGDQSGDGDGDQSGDGDMSIGGTKGQSSCDDLDCPSNSRCIERAKLAECVCDEGLTMNRGECVDEDACRNDPCGDGEVCVDLEAPDTGYDCEDVDGCADDPCGEDETCMDVEAPGTGFMCSGPGGCAGDPCGAGEECTEVSDPMDGYLCSDIDGCAGDPCDTGETCVDAVAPDTGYSCEEIDGCMDADVECLYGTCVDVAAPGTGYACDYSGTDTTCVSPEAAIESNTTIQEVITWDYLGTITDVTTSLDISHSFAADLDISLFFGENVSLIVADECGSNDNVTATFSDAGQAVMCGPDPAISGTVMPVSPLSAFDGNSGLGDWRLEIHDDTVGDQGTLNEWCLNISSSWSGTSTRGNVTGFSAIKGVSCPPGQVLTGFTAHGASDTDALQGMCGTPTPQGTDPMTVVPGATLDTVGSSTGGNIGTLACPENEVVVGFVGSTTPSGTYLRDLTIRCAPLDSEGVPGAISTTNTFGSGGGIDFPAADCPYGTVARSANLGTFSAWMVAMALGCEAL